jgi:hypothetical protein
MFHISVYVFTVARDEDDAARRVENRLEDFCGREFFDGFEVRKDSVVSVWSLVPEYVTARLKALDVLLRRRRKEAAGLAESGDKFQEGHALNRVGDILCEQMCEDMPWFNMEDWNWEIPGPVDISKNPGEDWYAVMTDFRY